MPGIPVESASVLRKMAPGHPARVCLDGLRYQVSSRKHGLQMSNWRRMRYHGHDGQVVRGEGQFFQGCDGETGRQRPIIYPSKRL